MFMNPNTCGCSSVVECLLPKQKIAGSSPVTRSTETKMNIIPDRLVAGRKILALLTVVRIHLRENKKQIPNRHLFFIFEKYSHHYLLTGHLVGSGKCHCEGECPKQSSFCRFCKVGNWLSTKVRNVRFW